MVKGHVWAIIMVVVCVLVSSIANVMGSLFIQTLIDKYIIPLSKAAHPEFSGLLRAVIPDGPDLSDRGAGYLCLQPHHVRHHPGKY